ncbi:MAG: hypothetical protein Q4Q03_07795 [Bowdeniella nasicola]|nr:hypothetical protein [Bowdeniella nasicola]
MRILSRAALRIDQVSDYVQAGLICRYATQLGFQAVVSPAGSGWAIELSRLDDFPPVNDIAALAVLQHVVDGTPVSEILTAAKTWLDDNDVTEVDSSGSA